MTADPGAPAVSHAGFQNEVYLAGLLGERPTLPFDHREVERAALAAMSPEAAGYVAGSAGEEATARANREAFDRWRLLPRVLREVPAQRDLSVELLGRRHAAPVLLAPVGVLSIVHPDGELAVARAAAEVGLRVCASTASSYAMEEVAAASASSGAGGGTRWFQLYWPSDRALAASFVRRAEAAGFEALVVTLDTWQLGWRPRDLATAYLPFLQRVGIANYLSDPVFTADLPPDDPMAAVLKFVSVFTHPALSWDDLAWLREVTSLPVVLKGLQHPADVARAVEAGVDAVVCSNHGGRQVDGAVASLDALPGVVEAAGDLPVLFDSGVRTGADVCKALALGARAVLLGRPYVYGLGLAGQDGVRHVLRCLLADLDLQMGLSGHAHPGALSTSSLVRQG